MRISAETAGAGIFGSRGIPGESDTGSAGREYSRIMEDTAEAVRGGRIRQMERSERENREEGPGEDENGEGREVRSEAEKIYQAAVSGKENPFRELRHKPKVPYEHLAKDGVINYNGVCFVCDEESNSICLGDMSDKKNVLTITLSGGGHLKVNRDNLGELSRAVGMFSPEDLNLIMRAIAKDTKIQSVKKEIEDTEAGVGNRQETVRK